MELGWRSIPRLHRRVKSHYCTIVARLWRHQIQKSGGNILVLPAECALTYRLCKQHMVFKSLYLAGTHSCWCLKMTAIQLSNKHVIMTWHQFDQVLPAGESLQVCVMINIFKLRLLWKLQKKLKFLIKEIILFLFISVYKIVSKCTPMLKT